MTTLLNILTVDAANRDRLMAMLRNSTETVIGTLDGWISTSLMVSADGTRVVIHSRWRDAAAIEAMRTDPRMMAWFPKIAAIASLESIVGEVAYETRL